VADEEVPSAVRAGSLLLLVGAAVAALAAAAGVLALRQVSAGTPAYLQALADTGTGGGSMLADLRNGLRYNFVIDIGAAAGLGALGWAVRRPWRTAQILTWCAAFVLSIGLMCGVGSGLELLVWQGDIDPVEVVRAREALLPRWYPVAHNLASAGQVVTMIIASLTLLRTTAQDFFRLHHQDGAPGLWSLARKTNRS